MDIIKWEKSIENDYNLYEYNYKPFWKRQNYEDSQSNQWLGVDGKGMNTIFSTAKAVWIMIMMDTCNYIFVQTHIMYNSKNEP